MSNLLENSLYYLSNKGSFKMGFDEVEVLTVIFCKFTLNLVGWPRIKKLEYFIFTIKFHLDKERLFVISNKGLSLCLDIKQQAL